MISSAINTASAARIAPVEIVTRAAGLVTGPKAVIEIPNSPD